MSDEKYQRFRVFCKRRVTVVFALWLLSGLSKTSSQVAKSEVSWLSGDPATRCALAADYSRAHNGVAMLVLHDGHIVFEQYSRGYSANKAHHIASGTKSFWGLAAVAACQDQLLRLDEPASNTLWEWAADSRKKRITIRQLLNFTDGLDPALETLDGGRIRNKFAYAINAVPSQAEPGKIFTYGPSHLCAFGEVLRRKLNSRNEDPLEYLTRRVLSPIRLKYNSWSKDKAGNPSMAAGAWLTARQWSKIGELIRNNGKWNRVSVLQPAILRECFQGSKANPAYGLTFWLSAEDGFGSGTSSPFALRSVPPAIVAAGAGGQRLYIFPRWDLVVVRLGFESSFRSDEFLARLLFGKPLRVSG